MAEIFSDDLVVRAYWPLPQWNGHRTSYGIPLTATGLAFLACVLARQASIGFPRSRVEVALLMFGFLAPGIAINLAFVYDGTELVGNRLQLVLKKWLRSPTVIPVSDLGRIVLLSVDFPSRGGGVRKPVIFFFDRSGRCVMSLVERFREEDLAQLWSRIGVTPEGSWAEAVQESKLTERFPGAFDQRAA